MADLVLTSSDWQSIRSLAEQGVDYTALAEQYGVSYGSIAVRSHREGWFTPDRVKIKLSKMSESSVISGKNTPSEAPSSEKKDQILAETWAQKADSLRILSFNTAVDAIKRSRGLIAIQTASDLKAAVHVARQATGVLDTEAPAISLNLGGGGGFFEQAGPVYEAVSDPVEPVETGEGLTLEGCGV